MGKRNRYHETAIILMHNNTTKNIHRTITTLTNTKIPGSLILHCSNPIDGECIITTISNHDLSSELSPYYELIPAYRTYSSGSLDLAPPTNTGMYIVYYYDEVAGQVGRSYYDELYPTFEICFHSFVTAINFQRMITSHRFMSEGYSPATPNCAAEYYMHNGHYY